MAFSYNRTILAGNLTRDPELRFTQSQVPFTTLRLAVNDDYKTRDGQKREKTLFIDVDVWRGQAETVCKYLSKGQGCLVEGRLELDQWDDRETGKPRSKIKLVAQRVVFLPRSGGGGGYRDRDQGGGRGDGGGGDGGRGGDGGQRGADYRDHGGPGPRDAEDPHGPAYDGPDPTRDLEAFGLNDDVPF